MRRVTLLAVENLTKRYAVHKVQHGPRRQQLIAVDDVSFDVATGSTFGLLGESGSGKSTLARIVLALEQPSRGVVTFRQTDVHSLRRSDLKSWRRQVQVVFQDPYGALAPHMPVLSAIQEPLKIHRIGSSEDRKAKANELLRQVGLDAQLGQRYPHELSGGQRQRVVIARALALEPSLVVCDEPTSALDVSVQARVLGLLQTLQQRFGLTYLFISHDLGVVRAIADNIGVMYMGAMVERAPARDIYECSRHPYTRALLDAMPSVRSPRGRSRLGFTGEPPSALSLPSGCRFRTRCPIARDLCAGERPALREVRPGHWSACHFAEELPNLLPRFTAPSAGAHEPAD